MKKAAIAIDDWKLPVFERHLTKAGFTYKKAPGLTDDTLFLTVEAEDMKAVETVVRAANAEAVCVSPIKTKVLQ